MQNSPYSMENHKWGVKKRHCINLLIMMGLCPIIINRYIKDNSGYFFIIFLFCQNSFLTSIKALKRPHQYQKKHGKY